MGVLRTVAIVGGVIAALFVGSAVISGIVESNSKHETQRLASRLTSTTQLQSMVLTAMKQRKGISAPCGFVGAIGYRLAEARDLKIPQEHAVDLANDRWLVEEIAKTGSDPRYVIVGLASQVYGSPLPPAETFNAQATACARSG